MDPRLHQAARLGDLAALKSLLEEDPLLLEKVALSPSADTPLHIATLAAKIHFVREMLHKMPNFAWELNQDGFTPLHIAAAKGNMEITRELLSLDSGLCLVKDKLGRTPLHWAAVKGRAEIAGELLSHCREAVEEVSDRGETALDLAVKNNQLGVLKVLVEKLGDDDRYRLINAQVDQGNTISQLAVAKGLVQAQNLLKNQTKQDKEGADVSPHGVQDQELQTKKSRRDYRSMIEVVASLIAAAAYQACLSPPTTIVRQGMKLDFKCLFRKPQKLLELNGLVNECPAFTYLFFMCFNTIGFFSSVSLLCLFRKETHVADVVRSILTYVSLACMSVTYITLLAAMSPDSLTTFMIYLIFPIFVSILSILIWVLDPEGRSVPKPRTKRATVIWSGKRLQNIN